MNFARQILWFFLKFGMQPKNMSKQYPPILLLELGNLQVYHFPSPAELTRGTLPSEVYWQDKKTRMTYGPFKSIYEATKHYTHILNTKKLPENVIQVDFKAKRRL